MLTILEGPDGAGKTTLARKIERRLAATVHHHGAYAGVESTVLRYWHSIRTARHVPVVMDRSWLSEPIYNDLRPVEPRYDRVGPAFKRMLARAAWGARALYVLCLPSVETCLRAWRGRPTEEMLRREEMVRLVHARYVALTPKNVDGCLVRYDYTEEGEPDLDRLEALRPPPDRGPGAGHFAPGNVLLVGEQHSDPASEVAGVPFFSLNRAGCAAWLAERLDEAGAQEKDLYWINAIDPRGRHVAPAFVERLEPRAIVALGRVAETWCRVHGVGPYVAVPHPQVWKRFHHHEPYPLVSTLREVLS